VSAPATAGAVPTVRLPDPGTGDLITYRPAEVGRWQRPVAPITSRRVFAAAHVVPDVRADNTPGAPAVLDWESTLAFRHELWSWGLGVADAMDTAQRGMGLHWAATAQLIDRSAERAAAVLAADDVPALRGRTVRDLLSCGAGTDQLDPAALRSGRAGLEQVLQAYREQVEVVSAAGATVILMASRALAALATGERDYRQVYDTLLAEATEPVILHWLGPMFDPALEGYWGSADIPTATRTVVDLITAHPGKVEGIKISLLDTRHELALRAALPPGVALFTGDDFNYPELVVGDEQGHSDALLGVFAAIAPAASTALQRLDAGADAEALAILESTKELGRHLFSAPTYHYKTGIAFLAWLNGHQPGFQMVGGLHAGRSVPHQVRTFTLAGDAGLLTDPGTACARMGQWLSVQGVSG
jgi:hypothetical protein